MKKILLLACMALMAVGAFAQKDMMELGVKLNYGFDAPHAGIGVLGRYNLDDHFRPEVSANFYPKNNGVSAWDISANLHYIFHPTQKFKVYPLGGLAILGANYDDNLIKVDGKTEVGFNLGGGIQYNINSELHLNAELYYQNSSSYDRAITNVSLVYVF